MTILVANPRLQQRHVFGLKGEVWANWREPRWARGEHAHMTT